MIKTPTFKAHLHVEIIQGEGVLILSETSSNALYGKLYEAVVPLINGQRSTDEIVDALAGKVDSVRVYFMLNTMEAKGYLAEACPDIPDVVAAFWHGSGVDPAAAQAALREKRVVVQTVGSVDSLPMLTALKAMDVQVTTKDEADLRLVLTDDYLREDLSTINVAALRENRPWLLVRVTGPELWLGPLFQPGHTGCWMCLKQRLERNRAVHCFVAQKNGLATLPLTALGSLPSTQAVACHMAVIAVTQFLMNTDNGLADNILSLNWATSATQNHTIVQHPYCPACGTQELPKIQPLQLKPGKVTFTLDGGHRSVPPEKTLNKYQHLVSPISGVVRMLERTTEADNIAHVYVAGSNRAFQLDRLDQLKTNLRTVAAGKGVSETQAKVSALCEAIERYSGERAEGEIVVTASYAEMRQQYNEGVVHPNRVMYFSDRQLAEHEEWNAKKSRFNVVPATLPVNQAIDWSPVWSLTHECHKYLPTQLLYYRSSASATCNQRFSIGCSNGCASGNTLEEAILQGFFELVERDAVALWWYNRLHKPGVALETFGEPYLLEMAEHYLQNHQRETWALDLTSDLGIPVFAAVSKMLVGKEEHVIFGLGCHLDARIAVQRAFAEMNQMLSMTLTGKDGELAIEDTETLEWLRQATVANQPYMAADLDQPFKELRDYPLQHSGEFLQDINHCRSIIESLGMEILVLDQTRVDVGMPVVKVVVPGLRHFWARYAPGRLYDVPVKMGWLDKPRLESELNPIPVFF